MARRLIVDRRLDRRVLRLGNRRRVLGRRGHRLGPRRNLRCRRIGHWRVHAAIAAGTAVDQGATGQDQAMLDGRDTGVDRVDTAQCGSLVAQDVAVPFA